MNTGGYNLSRSLIFILSITSLDSHIISRAFQHLFRLSVLNAALIVKLSSDNIVLVTYFPFTATECFSVKPVIINSYDQARQRWETDDYFPEKVRNFHGCSLTCATWEEMPYLYLERDETTQRVTNYEGFEGKLLEFAEDCLNFTTNFYIMNEDEITETHNETGLIFNKVSYTHWKIKNEDRFAAFKQSN